ncbi:hypothetical protein AGDE_17080 [Angomonas deanei]|uniref:Uncharacterized protein n=1 Tax=Angomonas deanei TaxID=59799 RepID=A0A7G2CIP2_9TRYP|nr:hypothetical protein AGDE_17080 [Angomonas deanei]CAD2219289.1 hypothetical protein, conserved [Angomonas deanei]|eukprot:EPY15542.1 hypothetical protein AGDE_17080 [Angomonas deanei]
MNNEEDKKEKYKKYSEAFPSPFANNNNNNNPKLKRSSSILSRLSGDKNKPPKPKKIKQKGKGPKWKANKNKRTNPVEEYGSEEEEYSDEEVDDYDYDGAYDDYNDNENEFYEEEEEMAEHEIPFHNNNNNAFPSPFHHNDNNIHSYSVRHASSGSVKEMVSKFQQNPYHVPHNNNNINEDQVSPPILQKTSSFRKDHHCYNDAGSNSSPKPPSFYRIQKRNNSLQLNPYSNHNHNNMRRYSAPVFNDSGVNHNY